MRPGHLYNLKERLSVFGFGLPTGGHLPYPISLIDNCVAYHIRRRNAVVVKDECPAGARCSS